MGEYAKGPRAEPDSIILLNGHSNKFPSKFVSMHSEHAHFSTLIREVSFYSLCLLIQRDSTGQLAENKRPWSTQY